jgi:hypothetical protein
MSIEMYILLNIADLVHGDLYTNVINLKRIKIKSAIAKYNHVYYKIHLMH